MPLKCRTSSPVKKKLVHFPVVQFHEIFLQKLNQMYFFYVTKISWNQNLKTASCTGSSITPINYFSLFLQVNNGVQIYQFPTQEESVAEANKQMNGVLPFAVVGSNDFVKVGNKMVRARQYPWGVGNIDARKM